jgi:hypothetical protein
MIAQAFHFSHSSNLQPQLEIDYSGKILHSSPQL